MIGWTHQAERAWTERNNTTTSMEPPVTAPLAPTERNGHSGVTPEECPLCAPLLHVMADMASVLREDERR